MGIDIGATQVKVAVLRGSPRRWVVEALVAIDRLATDLLVDDQPAALPTLTEALVEASKDHAAGGDPLVVGLEGAQTFVRTIVLPSAVRRRVAEVLPFELEGQLPFDLDEVVFDFRSRPGVPGDDPQPVLVVAARTEHVQQAIDIIQGALGREPDLVVPGAFALADLAATILGPRSGVRALLDLGSERSEILIVDNCEPVFARTLSRGVAGMPATAKDLAREIRQTFSAYRAAGGESPADVLLTGGGALVTDMNRWLAAELEMPVELLDLASSTSLEGLGPEERTDGHRFSRAVGLALAAAPRHRALDLRRGPLAFERGYGWLREKVPTLLGVGATLLVAFFFATWARHRTLSQDRVVLESALASVTKEVLGEATSDPDRVTTLLSEKGPASDDDPLPRADGMDVLVQLSELVPTSTMKHDVERIEMVKQSSGFKVSIKGIAPSVADVGTIETNLKTYRCFQNGQVVSKAKHLQDDRQKYTFEADLRCPEEGGGPHGKTGSGSGSTATSAGGH
ncbi:MAG: pilus assembly protein PilM [Polyangiales bacterium]